VISPVSPLDGVREALNLALACKLGVACPPCVDRVRDALAVLDSLDGTIARLVAVAEAAETYAAQPNSVWHTPELDTDPDSPADYTGRHVPDCRGCALQAALLSVRIKESKIDNKRGI
jgi:hypothetical protein